MKSVVIIGGGWAGCAASIAAKKAGANVILIERTDMLLGLGNVGGIMRNNGRFTAAEENINLGAYELFEITDRFSRHVNINFPGHEHASLYDVTKIEPEVKKLLNDLDVEIMTKKRAVDVIMDMNKIKGIVLDDENVIYGDVFIETTGSTGPMGNCLKYGNGCSMCILRCPTFGPRISISQKAGIKDLMGQKDDGTYGAFSGSCKLNKDSLSEEVRAELNEKGVVVLPVPKENINMDKLSKKVCQQYALREYAENIILLDTGHAKMMTSFYPLDELRKIKGLENARYEDPYSGGVGNSVRYLSMAPRENTMKVKGIDNLFCGGEKAGLFVGHTEAITTGSLAGHNSVRMIKGEKLLDLPRNLAVGDIISYANEMLETEEGIRRRYTFAGSNYFERMKDLKLYTIDKDTVRERVKSTELYMVYDKNIM
ncbi:FAD-dependent oxidoreductase [Sporanaerobacter acetigenes]|uniref:Glucose inhibited division protein A n=1 Tax=Sporanaerobacter acetigenes DSM 13106 TaxID=1123281 RepID=A0A1M5XMH0_9FIRM|nr:FAD-dependent oxidoreductase [Sporanaerobacter acetigenes]SHI01055.1 Glucose inhibited division protein A [Sporanaerobacter acetigenes DSM 13106]